MGDVKTSMKPSTPTNQGLLDRIRNRRKNRNPVKSDEEIAKSFVDYITLADKKIEELIGSKQKDLANEKGQETKNNKSIKLLEKMQFHIEEIADLAQEYSEL